MLQPLPWRLSLSRWQRLPQRLPLVVRVASVEVELLASVVMEMVQGWVLGRVHVVLSPPSPLSPLEGDTLAPTSHSCIASSRCLEVGLIGRGCGCGCGCGCGYPPPLDSQVPCPYFSFFLCLCLELPTSYPFSLSLSLSLSHTYLLSLVCQPCSISCSNAVLLCGSRGVSRARGPHPHHSAPRVRWGGE
jgi:hypothetical protein